MFHEQIEPFGDRREDLRAGILWSTVKNMVAADGAKPVQVWDYPLLKDLDPGIDLLDPDTL